MAKGYAGDNPQEAGPVVGPGARKPSPSVLDIIVSVAKHYKIPPTLALAIAQHESGFSVNAVGDNGTSFGLYQLHEGGELPAGKDRKWAADARNNAMVALKEVAAVYHRNPNLDYGTIAALAQRPADKAAYAQSVNQIAQRAGNGQHAYDYFNAAAVDTMNTPYNPGDWAATHPDIARATAASKAPAATSVKNSIGTAGGSASITGSGSGTAGVGGSGAGDISTTGNAADFTAQLNAAGFAKALLNSDPSLKAIFEEAISQGWYKSDTGLSRFQAAIRNTKWWTSRSDAQRKFDEMSFGDSATLHAQIGQEADSIKAQAAQDGITLTGADAWNAAKIALRNGMTDQEVANTISTHFAYNPDQAYTGKSGSAIDAIKQMAADYYVPVTDAQMQKWVQQVDAGTLDPNSLSDYFKQQATSLFPNLKQQLDAGQTVKSVADSYKSLMAQTLELDPNGIADNDPTVMKALQYKDPSSGEQTTMPLWQYQQQLKQDPRWLQTENAHNSLVGATQDLMKQWGLAS